MNKTVLNNKTLRRRTPYTVYISVSQTLAGFFISTDFSVKLFPRI